MKTCPICNKEIKGKGKTCSKECGYILREKNFIKKHGVKNPSQLREVKDKKIATNMERYGVTNPSQRSEIIDKKRENCIEEYGVSHWMKLDKIKDKQRNVITKKYGVNNAFLNRDKTWNKGLTKETDERVEKYSESGSISIKRGYDNGRIPFDSPEKRRKLRLSRIKSIKKNGGIFPNYNSNTIPFLVEFDKLNNTKGQYATSPCEYEIKELGYWLDYINFDLRLIIEIDESYHKYQKEKDIKRQKEIQKLYPDFKFLRFKDTEMNKILEERNGQTK